MKLSG
jgi:hypothetical protein